jgi:hypothetical protein
MPKPTHNMLWQRTRRYRFPQNTVLSSNRPERSRIRNQSFSHTVGLDLSEQLTTGKMKIAQDEGCVALIEIKKA